jgi:hypothetical protein
MAIRFDLSAGILGSVLFVMLSGFSLANAGSISDMKLLGTKGQWELRIEKDGFSDQKNCVIVNRANKWLQVSPGVIYIGYSGRGGIAGFEYRIDNNPSSGMQLPSETDQKIGTAQIKGEAFPKILHGKRLRIQALTVLDTLENDDYNLEGLSSLYLQMKAACK